MTRLSSPPDTPDRTHERTGERGRPREFDIDEVALSASQVFWEQGYHATSIEALCKATGLMRGSLYGAFGDKRGLLKERLDADLPPHEALRQALLYYTRVTTELSDRHGCFITNAALELLPAEETLRPHIETALQRISAQFAAAVVRGQKAGKFNLKLDENAVGMFLLCLVQGLRVLGKVDVEEKQLVAVVDMAMRALL